MTNELEKAANSVESVSHLHVYIYEPTYESADDFSWEDFPRPGSELAEELARLVTEVYRGKTQLQTSTQRAIPRIQQFPNRPLVFVAHSLGRLLLKKVYILCTLLNQWLCARLTIDRHYF